MHNGIIQGLHLDQKSFQVLQGNTPPMGFQFGQGFGIGGKRKPTHGHFKSVLFKIGPSFDHRPYGCQTGHQRAVVQQGTSNHAGGHQE